MGSAGCSRLVALLRQLVAATASHWLVRPCRWYHAGTLGPASVLHDQANYGNWVAALDQTVAAAVAMP